MKKLLVAILLVLLPMAVNAAVHYDEDLDDYADKSAAESGPWSGTSVVYNGTTLIGTATLVCSTGSWVWSGDFVAESGQSLNFSQNDDIYYGFCYSGGTSTVYYGRDGTNEPYDNYYVATGAPAKPVSWGKTGAYEFGIIFEYTY